MRKTLKTYPTNDHSALAKLLNIKPEDKVLDIGGGHNPFAFADIVADIDVSSGHDRDGNPIRLDWEKHQYVQADILSLPFPDNCFDFVICLHVLEHVDDPGLSCEELMRVARRGFLETPRKWTEFYAGYPTHKWLIDDIQETLVFEPMEYDTSPFLNFALPSLWESKDLLARVAKYPHVPNVQLEWDNRFDYIVHEEDVAYVISQDSEVFARKHYSFARNLLYWAASSRHGLYHASRATELSPDNKDYLELQAFYLGFSGQWWSAFRKGLTLKNALKAMLAGIVQKLCRLAFNCFRHITNFSRRI
jgi:hypothetical protein